MLTNRIDMVLVQWMFWNYDICKEKEINMTFHMIHSIQIFTKIMTINYCKKVWRSMGKRWQKIFSDILQASKEVNLSKWLLLRSVFFTKNLKFDWLNSCVRHLERFVSFEACKKSENIFCHLFPMERHKWFFDTCTKSEIPFEILWNVTNDLFRFWAFHFSWLESRHKFLWPLVD